MDLSPFLAGFGLSLRKIVDSTCTYSRLEDTGVDSEDSVLELAVTRLKMSHDSQFHMVIKDNSCYICISGA